MGITITNGGSHFLLKDSPIRYPPAPLVIVDPLNPANNIAHHVFGMWRVKVAFEEAQSKITATLLSDHASATVLRTILFNKTQENIGETQKLSSWPDTKFPSAKINGTTSRYSPLIQIVH